MPENTILNALDEAQREAASIISGPVRIIAGAGTGKTRTVTHKIANSVLTGQIPSSQILPLTHSQKAAGEMRHRLKLLNVNQVVARTFHAAALRQLKFFWSETNNVNDFSLLDNRFFVVKRALENKGFKKVTSEQIYDVSSEIGWAKSQLITPSQYVKKIRLTDRILPMTPEDISLIYTNYELLKSNQGKLDFEDLLGVLASLLENNMKVKEHVHGTYSSFAVDEFQDVDPLQMKLLKAWVGDREDLCIVGDPNQAIYSFKGASVNAFKDFDVMFPKATKVQLVKDYRSTPQVVNAASRLINAPVNSLIGQLPDGNDPVVQRFSTETLEENYIISTIKKLRSQNVPFSEMALLYRFNSQSARFETALARNNIPYIVADSEKFFNRPEIKSVLSQLWKDGKRNPEGVGLEMLAEVLSQAGFDRNTPPSGMGAARARFDALDALLNLVETLPGSSTLGVKYLVQELSHRAQESHEVTLEGVTLSTLHKAKGLEWDSVFMVNVTEGSLPSSYASSQESIQEEKRLAYVGMTRAKRNLFLTYAETNSKKWKNKPSRFLNDLKLTPQVSTRPKTTRKYSPKVKPALKRVNATIYVNCKSCQVPLPQAFEYVGVCSACMDEVTSKRSEALNSWRVTVAKTLKVSANDLLHDALLWQIVVKNPQKLSEIVDIDGFLDSKVSAYGRDIIKALK